MSCHVTSNEINIYDIRRDCILWTCTSGFFTDEYRTAIITNNIEANIENINE